MTCGLSILRKASLAWLLLAALALPASGAPTTVFFDGPVQGGQHEGLASGSLPAGVPVLDIDVYSVTGSLAVVEQSADGLDIGIGPAPTLLTSQWVVENLYGAFPGQVYLLFATLQNYSGAPFATTYNTDFTDESNEAHDRAGLVIDPLTGWVIVESEDAQSNPLFYVAIPLDFSSPGADCGGVTLLAAQACVGVSYFLENPGDQVFLNGPLNLLVLPQLGIRMAVVPEPGTGLLLGLGLVVLTVKRRRA